MQAQKETVVMETPKTATTSGCFEKCSRRPAQRREGHRHFNTAAEQDTANPQIKICDELAEKV